MSSDTVLLYLLWGLIAIPITGSVVPLLISIIALMGVHMIVKDL